MADAGVGKVPLGAANHSLGGCNLAPCKTVRTNFSLCGLGPIRPEVWVCRKCRI